MRTLFMADWVEVAFLHFRVDPRTLAAQVPLELDLHDGQAYVSLVAFTQRRLRPAVGGKWGGQYAGRLADQLAQWLSGPLASHEFLNVRTYVRRGDTRGIFFLAEWIPNRLAVLLGPPTYGLPYRLGRLDYETNGRAGRRDVRAGGKRLAFDFSISTQVPLICEEGGQGEEGRLSRLDQFLLERYTAYTHRRGVIRRFDVGHDPWLHMRVEAKITATSLLPLSGDCWQSAEFSHANYSAGTMDVRMSAPQRVAVRANSERT